MDNGKSIETFLHNNRLSVASSNEVLLPWSSSENIDTLIQLAYGLFIFSATAVKFIEDANDSGLHGELLRSQSPASGSSHRYLYDLFSYGIVKPK